MKLPFRPQKKKKLQAATARRVREVDYTEEPNVKLSNAFIVVLVLHVVAVGGIYAFNALKEHQPPALEETDAPAQPTPAPPLAAAQTTPDSTAQAAPSATPVPVPRTYRVRSGDTIAKIAATFGVSAMDLINLNDLRAKGGIQVGEVLTLPASATSSTETQPAAADSGIPKDSGATYTVVHGDTPVGIAHKLHVAYDDLIRLNRIEDPRKLKIGMKLKVPVKHPVTV